MKLKKSVKAIALTLALIICCSVIAFAANNLEEIRAYLNKDLKIIFNGQEQVMYDANGERVYPVSYNGTTYLPVRAICKMLGIDVTWNEADYQVELWTPDGAVNLIEEFTPINYLNGGGYTRAAEQKPIVLGNTEIDSYMWVRDYDKGVEYRLNHDYQTLIFYVYSTTDTQFKLWGDESELLASVDIKGKGEPVCCCVDVADTDLISFTTVDGNTVYIFNTYLY